MNKIAIQASVVDDNYSGNLTGWLNEQGELYPCEDLCHIELLYSGLEMNNTLASERGFIHIGVAGGVYPASFGNKPTKQQDKTLDAILSHPYCTDSLKREIYYFLEKLEEGYW